MTAIANASSEQAGPDLSPEELIERARSFRERLRAEQDATDDRGTYSPDTHELFREAGLYRTLVPSRFGGLEFDVTTFVKMVVEIARGCPGTGWCLSLGAGHGLQIGSLWGEKAQSLAIGENGEFVAPMRGIPMGTATRQADGGWTIQGKWDYCSGSPYATHAIVGVRLMEDDQMTGQGLALVPRNGWILQDDWRHRAFGMRGSGSNSIIVEGTTVPEEFVVRGNVLQLEGGLETPGYEVHKNAMYAGHSTGFLQLEITSVLVGCGYAALDEYERILREKKTLGPNPVPRFHNKDFQRYWGLASGKIHAAEDVLLQMSEYFAELSEKAVTGAGFDAEELQSINSSTHHAVNLIWEAVELLFRTSGTSEGGSNGSKMQRYYRDISTARTNIGLQYEAYATVVAQQHFGLQLDIRA